jgi:hypothetical protein
MSEQNEGRVTCTAAKGALIGAGTVLGIGFASWMLVPWTMSTFGVVVKGVGTIHAAGGVSSTLQTIAAKWCTMAAMSKGAVAGATVAKVTKAGLPAKECTPKGAPYP